MISAQNISLKVGKKAILSDIDFSVAEGDFLTIIGANGAGKSTLLKCACAELRDYQGTLLFGGENLATFNHQQLALKRAVLPQSTHIPFPMRVLDIVQLGRAPYANTTERQYDNAVIDKALAKVDMTDYKTTFYQSLSGGEQHRVQIARVLAQIIAKPDDSAGLTGKVLFLDEPTNHLDLAHQYQLMELLSELCEQGLTIVSIMHNLDLAIKYAKNILVLKNGHSLGCYSPLELLSKNILEKAYEMPIKSCWLAEYGCNVLIPMTTGKKPNNNNCN